MSLEDNRTKELREKLEMLKNDFVSILLIEGTHGWGIYSKSKLFLWIGARGAVAKVLAFVVEHDVLC